VLRAILLTGFFGFALHVWSKLKRLQCKLDDVVGKVDILQKSIKVIVVFLRVFESVVDWPL